MASPDRIISILSRLMQPPLADPHMATVYYCRYRLREGKEKAREICRRIATSYGHPTEHMEAAIERGDNTIDSWTPEKWLEYEQLHQCKARRD